MNGAFYVGAVGLSAQERALAVISNNIANINTAAFKRSDVRFSELVDTPRTDDARAVDARTLEARADARTADARTLASATMSGVAMNSAVRVFEQGDLKQTGKPFDIAVSGNGFIELQGPDGEAWLWRGGTLKVDRDGYLATVDGMPLKALISVPDDASELQIGRDGTVTALTASDQGLREIGKIELALVRDPATLIAEDGGYYRAALDSEMVSALPGEEGSGTIVQGAIETSNVHLSDEMVTLLLMQRAYSASAQVVQAGDQLMAIANSLRR